MKFEQVSEHGSMTVAEQEQDGLDEQSVPSARSSGSTNRTQRNGFCPARRDTNRLSIEAAAGARVRYDANSIVSSLGNLAS